MKEKKYLWTFCVDAQTLQEASYYWEYISQELTNRFRFPSDSFAVVVSEKSIAGACYHFQVFTADRLPVVGMFAVLSGYRVSRYGVSKVVKK